MKTLKIFLLYVLYMTSIAMTSAQKRSKRPNLRPRYPSGMKSPFQQPDQDGNHAVKPPSQRSPAHQPPGPPKKSPFTPPPAKDGGVVVTTKSQPPVRQVVPKLTTTKSDAQGMYGARIHQDNDDFKPPSNTFTKDRESPFKPPTPDQWRKDDHIRRREPVPTRTFRPGKSNYEQNRPALRNSEPSQERDFPSQRQNLQGVPPLSSIDVKPRKTPGRRRSRPVATPYQDSPRHRHRDIHDAEPGVTPWTRYTAKPRPSDTGSRRSHSQSAMGRCGSQKYSPRRQMCCEGRIVRRQGVQPSCCGKVGYDTVYNNCCGGVVSFRSATRLGC